MSNCPRMWYLTVVCFLILCSSPKRKYKVASFAFIKCKKKKRASFKMYTTSLFSFINPSLCIRECMPTTSFERDHNRIFIFFEKKTHNQKIVPKEKTKEFFGKTQPPKKNSLRNRNENFAGLFCTLTVKCHLLGQFNRQWSTVNLFYSLLLLQFEHSALSNCTQLRRLMVYHFSAYWLLGSLNRFVLTIYY